MGRTLAGFFGKTAADAALAAAVAAENDASTTLSVTEDKKENTPAATDAVKGEETDTPVDVVAGDDTVVVEVVADAADEITEEEEAAADEEIAVVEAVIEPVVDMATLPAAELTVLRANAESWNSNKGELAVLQGWYKNATGSASTAAVVDAADAKTGKKKSYEMAPWNQ